MAPLKMDGVSRSSDDRPPAPATGTAQTLAPFAFCFWPAVSVHRTLSVLGPRYGSRYIDHHIPFARWSQIVRLAV
eukprot:1299137-Prymnesium_polylepis.2